MKKTLVAALVAAAAVGSLSTPAFAGAPNNCVGQTMAFVAQGNPLPAPFVSAKGIGNVAKANAVSTKDAVGFIKFVVCA